MRVRCGSRPEGRVCLVRFQGFETPCCLRMDCVKQCEFVPSAGLETHTTAGQETGATDTESCGLRIRQQNRFMRVPRQSLRG